MQEIQAVSGLQFKGHAIIKTDYCYSVKLNLRLLCFIKSRTFR